MQLAVRRDDILAAIGDQEMPEQVVAVVRSDRGDLKSAGVDLPHALGTQRRLRLLEVGPDPVPVLGDLLHLEPSLLDQVAPDMERRGALLDRAQEVAALLGRLVVEGRAQLRGFRELRLVRRHHVAYVNDPIVPGVLRQDCLRRVHEDQIRHVAAGQRRYRLLIQRHERHEAVVELVATRFHVVFADLPHRGVFLRNEPLTRPVDGRLGLGIGDIWPRRGLQQPLHPGLRQVPNAGSC